MSKSQVSSPEHMYEIGLEENRQVALCHDHSYQQCLSQRNLSELGPCSEQSYCPTTPSQSHQDHQTS